VIRRERDVAGTRVPPQVGQKRLAVIGRVRPTVDDDVPALEDHVALDTVVVRVDPDSVTLAHVHEVDLEEGVGRDGGGRSVWYREKTYQTTTPRPRPGRVTSAARYQLAGATSAGKPGDLPPEPVFEGALVEESLLTCLLHLLPVFVVGQELLVELLDGCQIRELEVPRLLHPALP
jgi:hypothetical protein